MDAATVILLKAQRDEVRELLAETYSCWYDDKSVIQMNRGRMSADRRGRLSLHRERIEFALNDAMSQLDASRRSREKRK